MAASPTRGDEKRGRKEHPRPTVRGVVPRCRGAAPSTGVWAIFAVQIEASAEHSRNKGPLSATPQAT